MVTRTVGIQTIANASVVVTLVSAETLLAVNATDALTEETIAILQTGTADGSGQVELELWPTDRATGPVMYSVSSNGAIQYETLDSGATTATWNHYAVAISGGTYIDVDNGIPTRKLRQLAMPQNNNGRRRYTQHSIVPTSATTVPLCCIDVHGMGFQNGSTGVQSYARIKFTLGTWDKGTTMEVVLHRSGNNWRLDIQDLMGGSCDANNYFVQSRGSAFKQNTDGWLLASGQTENNSAITEEHAHYIGASGAEWSYPPVFWPSQSDWDITHYHPVSIPYKINKTIGGVICNSAVDQGSAASIIGLKFCAVNGATEAELATPYMNQAGTHIKVYLTNCPVYAGYRTMVNTEIEFADNNHTIWFYDSEQALLGNSAWETKPCVAVTGASDVQGTDLNSMIAAGYTYLWTEKRGYYNFGRDGAMCYELFDPAAPRMKVESGKLYLRRLSTDSWSTRDFTHCIIGAGTNEATNTVLARRGCKLSATNEWLAKIGQNGVTEISNIVNDIDTAVRLVKTSTTKPVILLFSGIQDPQGGIDTGGNWAITNISDGSSAGNMTATDWANVATFWDELADAIYEYATNNNIDVIDWNILSTQYSFSNEPGGLMAVGHHYNVNGWLKIADYADVVKRI